MRRDAPTVHRDTSLPEVFQAVVSTRLNRAFVVDDERRVVGLVSDAELLERVTPALRPGALRALMNRLPFAHPREAPILFAPPAVLRGGPPALGRHGNGRGRTSASNDGSPRSAARAGSVRASIR
jgi:hypothetical protein